MEFRLEGGPYSFGALGRQEQGFLRVFGKQFVCLNIIGIVAVNVCVKPKSPKTSPT